MGSAGGAAGGLPITQRSVSLRLERLRCTGTKNVILEKKNTGGIMNPEIKALLKRDIEILEQARESIIEVTSKFRDLTEEHIEIGLHGHNAASELFALEKKLKKVLKYS